MISIYLNPAQKFSLFIKGGWPAIFLILFAFGPFLFQIGGGTSAFVDLQFNFREVKQTRGFVIDMIETNLTAEDYPVYQYEYSFPIELETVYGTSFSSEFDLSYDQDIPIEYIVADPSLSRIVGSRFSKTPIFAYIGAGFFLISIVFIPLRLRRSNRISKVLRDGTFAQAKYTDFRETAVEINEQRQFELTYEYQVGKETHYEYLRTTYPDEAEDYLALVYSNQEPSLAILINKLPYALSQQVTDIYLEQTKG